MKIISTIFLASALLLSVIGINAQDEYVRGEDPQADAVRDLQTGMAGIRQATKDPVLLAQLMEDLKDPSIMEEAKKMMGNPEFQKQMKMMEKSDEFKSAAEKAKTMMDDPTESARVQAQMEHMVKRGQDTIQKEASFSMSEAMDAMADPAVMAEAAAMMKDKGFTDNLQEMAKDPSFKKYITAVRHIFISFDKLNSLMICPFFFLVFSLLLFFCSSNYFTKFIRCKN